MTRTCYRVRAAQDRQDDPGHDRTGHRDCAEHGSIAAWTVVMTAARVPAPGRAAVSRGRIHDASHAVGMTGTLARFPCSLMSSMPPPLASAGIPPKRRKRRPSRFTATACQAYADG